MEKGGFIGTVIGMHSERRSDRLSDLEVSAESSLALRRVLAISIRKDRVA